MAKILIVDDSPTVVMALRKQLETQGHEVATLDLMVRLPEMLRNDPPGLIVLDLEMPLLDGRTVGRLVRRFESAHIPIVIYSSHRMADLHEVADEIGADSCLPKGAPMDHVLATIDQTLNRPRLATALPN